MGNMLTFSMQADVIVNSVPTDMKLEARPGFAKVISEAAGSQLQNEIDKRYPNGIKVGELAVTGGYSLQCTKIYHGNLTAFTAKKEAGLLPEQVNLCKKNLFCTTVQFSKRVIFTVILSQNATVDVICIKHLMMIRLLFSDI